jgi:hypothetical protein
MEEKILALIPSRGRPNKLEELLNNIKETTSDMTDIVVLLDSDDVDNYKEVLDKTKVTYEVFDNKTVPVMMNEVCHKNINKYVAFTLLADDNAILTKNWDTILLDAMKEIGYWGVVFPSDGYHGNYLCVVPMVGYRFIKTIGWIHNPDVMHLFQDHILKDITEPLGLYIYVPDVIINHNHFIASTSNKSEFDETYKRHWGDPTHYHQNKVYNDQQDAYYKWYTENRINDIIKLRTAVEAEINRRT